MITVRGGRGAASVAGRFSRRKNALKLDNVVQFRSLSTVSSKVNDVKVSETLKARSFHSSSASAAGLRQSSSAAAAVVEPLSIDSELERMNEEVGEIIENPLSVLKWSVEEFDGRIAMSTSFGIQSAVLLHLATQVKPDIPVVWVDTGYLPAETYQYAEELRETLGLNLTIASNADMTPARMEALHGKLWEQEDAESHSLYGKLRKVVPLQNGLASLNPQPLALLSGLRSSQTKARANMKPIGHQQGRFKVLPLLKMSDEGVEEYIDRYDLPKHPLQAKGYVTVGDWHSSRPVEEGEDPRATRFGGKFAECGLHVDSHEPEQPPQEQQQQASADIGPILPESLERTGVKALGLTKANEETDIAVIMVKKLTEDGSFCRKCNDVAAKIETDNVTNWIGHTSVANVLDHSSEGAILAKEFGVATAPFFLVRDLETQKQRGEWKVVRSYLQLRKMLEKAADHKLQLQETNPQEAKADPEYQKAAQAVDDLRAQLEKLQLEIRDKAASLESAEKALHEKAYDVGLE